MRAAAVGRMLPVMGEALSVLFVVERLGAERGGPSRVVPAQCRALKPFGVATAVAFSWGGEALSADAETLGAAGIETLPLRSLASASRLWHAVRRHDVVHVNGVWAPLGRVAARFARLQGKPVVIQAAGMLEPEALSIKPWKKKLGFVLYQRSDLEHAATIHVTSAQEVESIRELGLRAPIALVPDPVVGPAHLRQKPDRSGGPRRLLFLSRIHPKKGLLHLVQAVAALRSVFEGGPWRLVIGGADEGGHLAEVRREIERLGVCDLIEFAGPVDGDDKWNLYQSADLFVLPSLSENFGLVIGEALLCGTPVVTTQGTPWPALESEGGGWWTPGGTAGLVRALERALVLPRATLDGMGRAGRDWVARDFSATFGRSAACRLLSLARCGRRTAGVRRLGMIRSSLGRVLRQAACDPPVSGTLDEVGHLIGGHQGPDGTYGFDPQAPACLYGQVKPERHLTRECDGDAVVV